MPRKRGIEMKFNITLENNPLNHPRFRKALGGPVCCCGVYIPEPTIVEFQHVKAIGTIEGEIECEDGKNVFFVCDGKRLPITLTETRIDFK